MNRRPHWIPPVRRGLPLFLAAVVCLAVWQVWLAWRVAEQGRRLAQQRARERVEQAADLAVAQVASLAGDWDLRLREIDAPRAANALAVKRPRGAVVILIGPLGIVTDPAQPLLFVPNPPAAADPGQTAFADAGRLEFQEENYPRALEALQKLALEPGTRSEAWLRIARVERKMNRAAAAAAAYERLMDETAAGASGVPYGLLAAWARCQLPGGAAGVPALRAALRDGRWPLRRETFDFYWSEVNRMENRTEEPPPGAVALSLLVSRLYGVWLQATGDSSLAGREMQSDSSLILWHATRARLAAMAAPPGWLDAAVKLPAAANGIAWRLSQPNVTVAAPGETRVTRSLADAQLPARLEFTGPSEVETSALNGAIGRRDSHHGADARGRVCHVSRGDSRAARGAASIGFRLGGVARIPLAAHHPAHHRRAAGAGPHHGRNARAAELRLFGARDRAAASPGGGFARFRPHGIRPQAIPHRAP